MRGITTREGRTQSRVKEMHQQIIIIGGNDIGVHLAETLGRHNQNVVLIDEKEEVLHELHEEVDVLSLVGNPFALETLKTAGIGEGTRLITVTSSDEVNLLLLFLGESLGIKDGFALVSSQEQYESFTPKISRSQGKLHIIHLWELVSREVEKRGALQTRILLTDRVRNIALVAVEFMPKHPFIGESIKNLKLNNRSKPLFLLKKDDVFLVEPHFHIETSDILLLQIDLNEQERALRNWFSLETGHKVMIGGDQFLQTFKNHWSNFSHGLFCIEKNPIKCQQMLKVDGHAIILKGDGLDISLLKEARVEDAKLFFAASENDEVNLLSSLLAKSFGVKNILTILRKRQHTGMLEILSLDGIISIPELVVEHMLSSLLPSRKNSSIGLLEMQLLDEKLSGSAQFVFRGGVLMPVIDQKIRDGEELITIRPNIFL